jgi:hypothetical protein
MIPFTNDTITAILDYVGEIVGDFMPLIVVFFGVMIGFWIIDRILHRGGE